MSDDVKITERQTRLLRQIVLATDGKHPAQLSGAADACGLVVRGPTLRALERRGLVRCGGFVTEVDGDGYAVREDQPLYVATEAGRALASPDAPVPT